MRPDPRIARLEPERRFQLLVDGVTDTAIYMLDPDGLVASWNSGAERIKGYSAKEIIGQPFARFFSSEDIAAGTPQKLLADVRASGRIETEGWRVRKDGSRFWSAGILAPIRDSDGTFLGYAKLTRDMTERESARRALAESERQLRLLVRSVVDYALFMLDPNGIVSSWNSGAERIKGYVADEIIGRHFSCFYTPPERLAGTPRKALETAAATGRYEAEGLRVRKDGSQFWAHVIIDAIRDEDGSLVGFAKITRDVTERRQAQEALRKAQEQLAYNQKMEALGQLTGGIAHDFNNLLMIVGGQTDLLKRRATSDSERRSLDAIEQAVRHGARLTRQMLSFARANPITRQVVDLRDRVNTFHELLSSSLRADIKLAMDIAEDVRPVLVDAAEFELALVNLAVNARDAMPTGGSILLKIENRVFDTDEQIGVAGEFVEVSMADCGTGIAPEHLSRIWEPFFTTKEPGKGTGLGLSQVYGFARHSGGTVRVSSQPGRGTTVSIFLPQSREQQAGQQDEPGLFEQHAASGTILVVEDNLQVSEISAALIEQLGYATVVAADANEALNLLKTRKDIVLVFSDIVMPGSMDGLALARAVRDRTPSLPVVLTSGYSKLADEAGREFQILRKPYEISALARAIRSAIEYRD